jgi:excinuclease ABC subunit A
VREGTEKRLADSIESTLKRGNGVLVIDIVDGECHTYSEKFACTDCGISLPEIEPRTFSFNSPYGACTKCHGLGTQAEFDPALIAPDHNMSIGAGALRYFVYKSGKQIMSESRTALFAAVATSLGFTMETPLKDLTPEQLHSVFHGVSGNVSMEHRNRWGKTRYFDTEYAGIISILDRHLAETTSDYVKADLEQYRRQLPCPDCKGKRLKPEALSVKVGDTDISTLTGFSVEKMVTFFDGLTLTNREAIIARQIVKEIRERLGFLFSVGLGYLTMDRSANTLAGGEAQRIRLATQIGSGLMGVLYILDEPSIGLHQRDNTKLVQTLTRLRDLGNTILVVEHDEETMAAADWLIDIGPGAGVHGGRVVAEGPPADILNAPESATAAFLSGRRVIAIPEIRREGNGKSLILKGAKGHNLKGVDIEIPLGSLVCITGVSGSGKSTLIQETLYPKLMQQIYRSHMVAEAHDSLTGIEHIEKIVDIDQSPIGRTPRSNPATYTGCFDVIRDLYASTQESRVRGYGPGRFSFNVKGGRCEACKGDGILKIEMQFLPDVYVPCEVCNGKRYARETLEVKYKGKSIAEVLDMTVGEGVEFFSAVPSIARKLQTIADVGLDYIKLGQPATTLSGGEAQRVKLATELGKKLQAKTLYILDEPTTGLHFADIEKLLLLLQRLVDAGSTVLVIEHNLDVIKCADWIVDMGPEGGDGGGLVIAKGTPEDIAKAKGSYTGQYLKHVLKGKSQVKRA